MRSRGLSMPEAIRWGETMRKVVGATEDAAEGMRAVGRGPGTGVAGSLSDALTSRPAGSSPTFFGTTALLVALTLYVGGSGDHVPWFDAEVFRWSRAAPERAASTRSCASSPAWAGPRSSCRSASPSVALVGR